MAISIITDSQFDLYIKEVINPKKKSGRPLVFVWKEDKIPFNGIVLYSSNVKGYYADGINVRFLTSLGDDEIEIWLSHLSEENRTNALFRLNEWSTTTHNLNIDFSSLCDLTYDLYIPKNGEISKFYDNFCIFKLNDRIFSVASYEQDQYNSFMDCIDEIYPTLDGFFKTPIATVKLCFCPSHTNEFTTFTGYELRDVKNNYVWLKFGTNHDPSCSFFVYNVNIP